MFDHQDNIDAMFARIDKDNTIYAVDTGLAHLSDNEALALIVSWAKDNGQVEELLTQLEDEL